MRTPGNDFELAAGWLVHEGVARPGDIGTVAYCTDVDLAPEQEFNVVTVTLDGPPAADPPPAHDAGHGVLGVRGLRQDSIDAALTVSPAGRWSGPLPEPDVVRRLPELMRERQTVFSRTGGVHAAGLFDADGTLLVVREDVGRHNAVDKVTGARVLAGDPPAAACWWSAGGPASSWSRRPRPSAWGPWSPSAHPRACPSSSPGRAAWRCTASPRRGAASATPERVPGVGTPDCRRLLGSSCAHPPHLRLAPRAVLPPGGHARAPGCLRGPPARRGGRGAVDLVVVSGDVYDRALPHVDAVRLADETLARLAASRAKVVLTSGNHDSAQRLGFSSRLIDAAGVFIRTDASTVGTPVLLEDEHGPVAVHGIPYLDPDACREPWGLAGRSHEAALTEAMRRVRADLAAAPGPPARSCWRTPSSLVPSRATPSATSSAACRSCRRRCSTASTTRPSATCTGGTR